MQHPHLLQQKREQSRRGLTLLELLISLGLALMLISAIGGTLSIYLHTETAGRERMERAQLNRAIYLKLSDDIRCTIFRIPLASEEDEENAELSAAEAAELETRLAEAESETGTTEVEPVDPEAAITDATVGLFGDAEKLVLHINRPRRPSFGVITAGEDNSDTLTSSTNSGYLRSITWFLADEGGTGLASAVATRDLTSDGGSVNSGLSRIDNDLQIAQYAEMETDPATLPGQAVILAPEVDYLQFRYFDGIDWVTEWDSEQLERLPNAVEITIGYRPPTTEENEYLSSGESSESENSRYRMVIALPLAPPPLTEVEL